MQVQAIQGYFDNGIFYQHGQRVVLPERKLVIVNVLDLPIDADETKKADVEFWKEFDKLAKDSVDDELLMTDFPRMHFSRELVSFNDGDN